MKIIIDLALRLIRCLFLFFGFCLSIEYLRQSNLIDRVEIPIEFRAVISIAFIFVGTAIFNNWVTKILRNSVILSYFHRIFIFRWIITLVSLGVLFFLAVMHHQNSVYLYLIPISMIIVNIIDFLLFDVLLGKYQGRIFV